MTNKKLLAYITGAIVLYLVSTTVSYATFTLLQKSTPSPAPLPSTGAGHFVVDPSLPRTEECPLTGQKFTKMEKDIWVKRRPLAVMIENHEESRPQTGLSYADVVYETVAEGGVTRFMGVYYCGIAAYNIGLAPVRSARTYFLDWVSEYDAFYNHVGGAGRCNDDTVDDRAKALCQIGKYGIKDLDQFGLPIKTKDKKNIVCIRNYDRLDHEVATEHTMVCYSDGLYRIAAEERDWTNVDEDGVSWDENFTSWKFEDDAKTSDRGSVGSISFSHWEDYAANYGVKWEYDPTTNSYKRFTGGKTHTDLETNQQLLAKNVVIQFAKETVGVDDHGHLLYGTVGDGKALVFQNGQAIVSTWEKPKRTSRTKFFDDKQKEIKFIRGPVWIEVVDIGTKITY